MSYIDLPTIERYLAPVAGIQSVHADHQRTVTKYLEAHRRIDFAVDHASRAADFDRTAEENKYLRAEEKWHDRACELEAQLPQREVANAWKRLTAALGVK